MKNSRRQKTFLSFLQLNRHSWLLRKFSSLILFIFISFPYFSQDPIFKSYGIENGLPSNEAHYVTTDTKGYVWTATDAGIACFDGINFKVFSLEEGLPESSVLRLYADRKGRMWFSTISSYIGYIENGKVFYNLHKFKAPRGPELDLNYAYSMYLDDADTLWVSTLYSGLIYKLTPPYTQKPVSQNFNGSFLIEFNKHGDYISGSGFQSPTDYPYRTFTFTHIQKWKRSKKVYNFPRENFWRSSLVQPAKQKTFIFNTNENVKQISELPVNGKLKTLLQFKNRVLFSNIDPKGWLWVSVMNEGLYLYREPNNLQQVERFFKQESITQMAIDNEGGTWLTSLFTGLTYVPSFQFKQLLNKPTTTIRPWINGQLLFNQSQSEIETLDLDQITNSYPHKAFSFFSLPEEKLIYFYSVSKNNSILPDILDFRQKQVKLRKIMGDPVLNVRWGVLYKELHKKKNSYYGLTIYSIHKFDPVKLESHEITKSNHVLNSFVITDDNKIWATSTDGLLAYDIQHKKWTEWGKRNKILSTRMEQIKTNKDGHLFIATRGKGLIVVDKTNKPRLISKKNGLNSNFIRYIIVDENNHVWLATNEGLSLVSGENFDHVYNFDLLNRFNLGVIHQFLIENDQLYVTSTRGLFKFNITDLLNLRSKKSIPLYITKVTSQNKTVIHANEELTYRNHYAKFNFEGISYFHARNIQYAYKMKGLDENWRRTSHRFVEFNNLPPGKYEFIVRPVIANQLTATSTRFAFTITKPFWLMWWFQLSLLVGIVFLLRKLILWQIERVRRVERAAAQTKIQLATLEAKALRSQMNPHFIFNALGLVQSFILRHEAKLANHYLGKFSKLMRRILESSKHEIISLQDEIDLIKDYLDLDQMRYNDHFEYEINYPPELSLSTTFIPIMLIQPGVENAIIHGLASLKNRRGKLKINIQNHDSNTLLCTIEDNGIGREASGKINQLKQQYHKSVSGSLTEERLTSYNKIYQTKAQVYYEDLYDSEQVACGTKMVLLIPKLNKNEMENHPR